MAEKGKDNASRRRREAVLGSKITETARKSEHSQIIMENIMESTPVMDKPVNKNLIEARGSSGLEAVKREIAVWKPAQHKEYATDMTGAVN